MHSETRLVSKVINLLFHRCSRYSFVSAQSFLIYFFKTNFGLSIVSDWLNFVIERLFLFEKLFSAQLSDLFVSNQDLSLILFVCLRNETAIPIDFSNILIQNSQFIFLLFQISLNVVGIQKYVLPYLSETFNIFESFSPIVPGECSEIGSMSPLYDKLLWLRSSSFFFRVKTTV